MPQRIIDLSVALTAGIRSDPPRLEPPIDDVDRDADELKPMFGIPADRRLEGKG